MQLTFEYTIECGSGHSPQCIHDNDNNLRVIYLTTSGIVRSLDAVPELGLYDNLEFTKKNKVSPDEGVSFPSLKRVAHYGAYGFWSAEGDHRFVIYMMPTDVSNALVDGQIQFSSGNEVSTMSCTLLNIGGALLNRNKAVVTPGTKIEMTFALGSDEIALGVFYIDTAKVSYPEEKVSVSARNAIGKLLKEQTFDDDRTYKDGSVQTSIQKILKMAEVEDYFVGETTKTWGVKFNRDVTILDGLQKMVSMLSGWKLEETTAGVVGIASSKDTRFDQPSTYTFDRDKTCFSYQVEYDDSDAAAHVTVYTEGDKEEEIEAISVTKDVPDSKWWIQPSHRTLYVKATEGADLEEVTEMAEKLATALSISGRLETFAGLFTPQLIIGDEVHIYDENGDEDTVGTVTDITHSFGRSGFLTSFTVDSGGRKKKARLKDLISKASKNDSSTGVKIIKQKKEES